MQLFWHHPGLVGQSSNKRCFPSGETIHGLRRPPCISCSPGAQYLRAPRAPPRVRTRTTRDRLGRSDVLRRLARIGNGDGVLREDRLHLCRAERSGRLLPAHGPCRSRIAGRPAVRLPTVPASCLDRFAHPDGPTISDMGFGRRGFRLQAPSRPAAPARALPADLI